MKMKSIFISLFLSLSLAVVSVNLSGCSAGGHVGSVGGSASVG